MECNPPALIWLSAGTSAPIFQVVRVNCVRLVAEIVELMSRWIYVASDQGGCNLVQLTI